MLLRTFLQPRFGSGSLQQPMATPFHKIEQQHPFNCTNIAEYAAKPVTLSPKLPHRTCITFMNYRGFLLIVTSLVAFSCKTAQPMRPAEQYEERYEVKTSTLYLPVEIKVAALERALNSQFANVVYEDNSFNDGDNMTVKATRRDAFRLRVEGTTIYYKTPLNLLIRYDTGLGKVDADASIELNFRTSLQLTDKWSLETNTQLEGYRWLSSPRLRLGSFSLPVETIANYVLKRAQSTLADAIDTQIARNLKLEQYVAEAWKMMHQPFEMSAEYKAWLLIQPQRLGMTRLESSNGIIRSTIFMEVRPEMAFGPRPANSRQQPLPPFAYQQVQQANQPFSLYVDALVTYDEAERMARQAVQGMTFSQGRRSVKIKDIELYGQGSQLVVNLFLEGSYDGNIYLTGRPEFNPLTNTVDLKDLEFTLDTRSFLAKSAGWLLQSTLKTKIQESVDFLMQYNIEDLRKQVQASLNNYKVSEGITINGQLHDLNLYNAYLTTTGIRVHVAISGDVKARVEGLQF